MSKISTISHSVLWLDSEHAHSTYNYRKCLRSIINHRRPGLELWWVNDMFHMRSIHNLMNGKSTCIMMMTVYNGKRRSSVRIMMSGVQQMCQCCKLKCTLKAILNNYSHIKCIAEGISSSSFFTHVFVWMIISLKGICSLITIIICLSFCCCVHDKSFLTKNGI